MELAWVIPIFGISAFFALALFRNYLPWQGKYIADKREGKWEWFWLNTNLQRREVFKNDEIISQKCFERDGSGRERKCLEVRSQ